MRLKDRVAIVVGAGQSPGEGMGNGRATALTFAREGAKVLCVDHNLASAEETVAMIKQAQGTAMAFKAASWASLRTKARTTAPRATSALITALPVLPPAPVTRIIRDVHLLSEVSVIARSEATKQSRVECVALDCFAEPVIRRRYAPTGWLAMTGLPKAS